MKNYKIIYTLPNMSVLKTGDLLSDPTPYIRLIGRLVNLNRTWPNITFIVHYLSQLLILVYIINLLYVFFDILRRIHDKEFFLIQPMKYSLKLSMILIG